MFRLRNEIGSGKLIDADAQKLRPGPENVRREYFPGAGERGNPRGPWAGQIGGLLDGVTEIGDGGKIEIQISGALTDRT